MPAFAPATDQAEITLPEPGKYIVKCVAIEDAPDKGFGPGVKWVFQLTDPTTGVTSPDELWQFTSTKMGPRSKARPIIEALYGRPLDTAKREVPDAQKMIGRSMIGVVIHEKREDGSDKATVTSCKPYTEQAAASASTTGAPARPRPAPSASGQGGLLDQVKSAIRKTEILQTPHHLTWMAMNLDGLTDGDLYSLLEDINADIQAA